MNLNALDNLLYKKKNVLAHPLKPDVQHLQKRKKMVNQGNRRAYAENLGVQV